MYETDKKLIISGLKKGYPFGQVIDALEISDKKAMGCVLELINEGKIKIEVL